MALRVSTIGFDATAHRFARLAWFAAALCLFASDALSEPTQAVEATTPSTTTFKDFARLVEKRCLECHAGDFPRGGLSLADEAGANAGGDSRTPITHQGFEGNELWKRVTTDNAVLRMPKDGDPLSIEEIETIRRWIAEGSLWPTGSTIPPEAEPTSPLERPTRHWSESIPINDSLIQLSEILSVLPFLKARLLVLLALGLIVLVAERMRNKQASLPDRVPQSRFQASLQRLHAGHVLAAMAFFCVATFAEIRHRQFRETSERLAVLEAEKRAAMRKEKRDPEVPPTPIRMRHTRGLEKTYYRGNCESNDALFNQGAYRTAVFQLRLVDANGDPISPGKKNPIKPLAIDFTMTRSRGSARELFSQSVIDNVFFSTHYYGTADIRVDPHRQLVETVIPDQEWRVRYPLESLETENGIEGVIYFYKGTIREDSARGEAHYAIVCEIPIENGQIAPTADIWMDAVFIPNSVVRPVEGKLLPGEWFDVRPIPEIIGDNSTDPELLGLPEHLGGRQQTPQADSSSESAPSTENP